MEKEFDIPTNSAPNNYDYNFPISLELLDNISNKNNNDIKILINNLINEENNFYFNTDQYFNTNIQCQSTKSLIYIIHKILTLPRASKFVKAILNVLKMAESNLDSNNFKHTISSIPEDAEPLSDVKSSRWRSIQATQRKLKGLRHSERLVFSIDDIKSLDNDDSDSSDSINNSDTLNANDNDNNSSIEETTTVDNLLKEKTINSDILHPKIETNTILSNSNISKNIDIKEKTFKDQLELLKKPISSKKKKVPYTEHQVLLPFNFYRYPILDISQFPAIESFSSLSPKNLPKWFSIQITENCLQPSLNVINIPLKSLLIICNSSGNLLPFLETFICQNIFRCFAAYCDDNILVKYENYINAFSKQFPRFANVFKEDKNHKKDYKTISISNVEKLFFELNNNINSFIYTKTLYKKTIEEFIYFRENINQLKILMKSIEEKLINSIDYNLCDSITYIEQFLITLLGNSHEYLRERSCILLNCLYDRHLWQLEFPFTPKIRCINDSFTIEIPFKDSISDSIMSHLVVAVSSPSLQSSSNHQRSISYHIPVQYNNVLVIEVGSFTKAGYYDWAIGRINPAGYKFIPLSFSEGQSLEMITIKDQIDDYHGRFIVHPRIRKEILHEVFIDIEGAVWDRINGGPIKRAGTFASLTKALDDYVDNDKITTIYVMGALERSEFGRGNPFSPIDRASPNRVSGGIKGFNELLTLAKKKGIKIIVDAVARVSKKGYHRKYRNLECKTLDENGMLQVTVATDGAEQIWKDCKMLNYRKKENWDLYINDILSWAKLGVNGIRIESAHCCPLILTPDNKELERMDSDGHFHYSLEEIITGDIVNSSTNEAYSYGYFGSNAYKNGYANPFFIKLTSTIWELYPNFIFTAEAYWNRQINAIISGLIPFSTGLSQALTSVFGTGLTKDGSFGRLHKRQDVKAFYDWYEMERTTYPQNSIVIYASANHYSPYPVSIYGRGAWSAVDLLYFLPEIPATFVGEHGGWSMDYDFTSNSFHHTAYDSRLTALEEIRGHYTHRAKMRQNIEVLTSGGLILLYAKINSKTWHDRVFVFARFKLRKMAIIAINFNDVESTFYIDFSPLKNLFSSKDKIYKRTDFINPSIPPMYFSLEELLNEKQQVTLQPYKSMCWGIFTEIDSPAARRVLFEHSFNRLSNNLDNNIDPSHNLVYSDFCNSFKDSINKFDNFIETLTQQLPQSSLIKFPKLIRNALAITVTSDTERNKLIATLEYLKYKKEQINIQQLSSSNKDSLNNIIDNVYKQILECNTLGPLVFITPEIGRFSKVGGIAVMVDELTQALVSLGCEIIIISPYYNFDRKGKTGYLKKEKVKYFKNIIAFVGNEGIDVGIHELYENGIKYYFIHHFDYFPTPYHAGSSIHQLKTIVLMAKASLELCCQLRILPALIISNDWFTGLVPAYGRKSSAFGTTFEGVTFFHLVHNLEEGYEGKIYLDGSDHLGYIHHLPQDIVVDPSSNQLCINASRCALLSCNQWGTVSKSYCNDLMHGINPSPLRYYLANFPQPFAYSNGIRVKQRQELLDKVASNHTEAKKLLQEKYFTKYDPDIPIFSFVGRICLQKGVHLILNAVNELINIHKGKLHIIIGGMANYKDPYAAQCAWTMQGLRATYPSIFWADPNEFFTDGPLVNLGSDFALMPSLFEPSGVVQQEYFIGGTPVIAFKTGGLKDTVFEGINGNGLTFEAHTHKDFVDAISRAILIFKDKQIYSQLRKTAKKSVLDMIVVANAWAKEFARLRQCIWYNKEDVLKQLELLKEKDK